MISFSEHLKNRAKFQFFLNRQIEVICFTLPNVNKLPRFFSYLVILINIHRVKIDHSVHHLSHNFGVDAPLKNRLFLLNFYPKLVRTPGSYHIPMCIWRCSNIISSWKMLMIMCVRNWQQERRPR